MKKSIFAAATVALVAAAANAQVTNGGFETGDFSGWNVNANFTSVQNFAAHSGGFGAWSGPTYTGATISQSLTGVNAGDTVEVRFWLGCDPYVGNSFSATLDGMDLMTPIIDSTGFGYTEIVGTVTVSNANPTLVFNVYNSPAYWYIDDVSASVVPTPGAAALIGLGGVAAGRRRRR